MISSPDEKLLDNLARSKYQDIFRLVNEQKNVLHRQNNELIRCDAEITFIEERYKDEYSKLSYIKEESSRMESKIEENNRLVGNLEELVDDSRKMLDRISDLESRITQMNSAVASLELKLEIESQKRTTENDATTIKVLQFTFLVIVARY